MYSSTENMPLIRICAVWKVRHKHSTFEQGMIFVDNIISISRFVQKCISLYKRITYVCMGTCIFTTIPISIHLNFFFLCMYHLTHTTNMYLSNTHTYSSSYSSYRQLPTYNMLQAIYYSMLGGPIYMMTSSVPPSRCGG
jgi:hypothetical protein